jgi:hypothetical protein
MSETEKLFRRLDDLLDRLELMIPAEKPVKQNWSYRAYRWHDGQLQGIADFHRVNPEELLHIERQASQVRRNTRQFVQGLPANNILLWGARGTGKSSIIKAQLNEFYEDNLCIVEVGKKETAQLQDIISTLALDKRKYLVYMDDLSFESDDESYKALKAALEGSIQPQPENVLIYATSNRRHLMPESMQDNLDSTMQDGQLHPSDAIEEKISLSDRFGLWLSFHPFTQQQYLDVVQLALEKHQIELNSEIRTEALRFATQRGSRSGRIAVQFAIYWLGIVFDD